MDDITRRMQEEIDALSGKLIEAQAENRRLTAVIEQRHATVAGQMVEAAAKEVVGPIAGSVGDDPELLALLVNFGEEYQDDEGSGAEYVRSKKAIFAYIDTLRAPRAAENADLASAFAAYLAGLPAPIQENIKLSAARGESFTYKAFEAGFSFAAAPVARSASVQGEALTYEEVMEAAKVLPTTPDGCWALATTLKIVKFAATIEAKVKAKLAIGREAILEEAAAACESWGDAKVAKWADHPEMSEDAKARAWDGLQCAHAIRALKSSPASPVPPTELESKLRDAVTILRGALVQAECAIKGREHTGFITKALCATEFPPLGVPHDLKNEQQGAEAVDQQAPVKAGDRISDGIFTTILDKNGATVYNALKSAGRPAQRIVSRAAPLPLPAQQGEPSVEKLMADMDTMRDEFASLSSALAFWLPNVPDEEGPIKERVLQDVFYLGEHGPDKSAQELGWITVNSGAASLLPVVPSGWQGDLQAIDRAMQHMGDVLNNMDAVEDGDEQLAAPGFDAIQRLLAAASQGWVVVPAVPTPKMVDATFDDRIENESHNKRNKRIYAAMLAAAPVPQANPNDEQGQDAARYRWMRRTFINDNETWPDDVSDAHTGEQLDIAIDAALGVVAPKEGV